MAAFPPAMPFLAGVGEDDVVGAAMAEAFHLPAPLAAPVSLPPVMPFMPGEGEDAGAEALAAIASFLPPPAGQDIPQTSSTTGTVNQFVPTSSLVYLTNAADVTINGILAGYDGQEVTFVAAGTNPAFFNPQNGGATAADRLANWVTIGFTPIAPGGTVTYKYDATAGVLRWRLIAHNQGDFLSIPFASCVYDSNTGAFWTVIAGNVTSQKYFVLGRTLFVHVALTGTTTVAGVGARLRIDFSAYAGWTWLNTTRSLARVTDGGAAQAGMMTAGSGGVAIVQFSHDLADTAWAAGAGRAIDGATVLVMLT
jgi:hypothetical protein